MNKLPVFQTIGHAYRFARREVWTIIRLAWFPILVVSIVQYGAAYALIDAIMASGGATSPASVAVSSLLTYAVSVIGGSMVAVALHRVILFGDRKPGTYILFSFGRAERLFMAFSVIVLIAGFVAVIAIGIVAGVTGSPRGLLLILVVVVFGFLAYLSVRLTPLYPVMVVDGRLDFQQSFDLSRGNFWRLFGVLFIGLIGAGVALAIARGLLSIVANRVVGQSGTGTPVSLQAAGEALQSMLPFQTGLAFVSSIVLVGLGVPLICYSYKALRNLGPDDLLPLPGHAAG